MKINLLTIGFLIIEIIGVTLLVRLFINYNRRITQMDVSRPSTWFNFLRPRNLIRDQVTGMKYEPKVMAVIGLMVLILILWLTYGRS